MDSFKRNFKIGSPSKLFADEIGSPIAQGIGEGITSGMKQVQRLAKDAIAPVTPGQLAPALQQAGGTTINMQQTNNLPAAPQGFDREGLMQEIDQRTIKMLIQYGEAT